MAGALLTFVGCSSVTPIDAQNCHELASTFRKIDSATRAANASGSVSDLRKTMDDAAKLNRRADALGGCADEPSLR